MSQELASMYRASVFRAEEAIFGEGTFEGQRFGNAHAKWTREFTAANFRLPAPANPTAMFQVINTLGGRGYFDEWENKRVYAPLSTGVAFAGDPRVSLRLFAKQLQLRIGLIPVLARLKRWAKLAKEAVRLRAVYGFSYLGPTGKKLRVR